MAPELLGLPLAPPWRRLAALLTDLALIAILSRLGGTALAITAALFFLLLFRRGRSEAPPWGRRVLAGCLGLLLLGVAVPAVIGLVALVRGGGAEQGRELVGPVETGVPEAFGAAGADLPRGDTISAPPEGGTLAAGPEGGPAAHEPAPIREGLADSLAILKVQVATLERERINLLRRLEEQAGELRAARERDRDGFLVRFVRNISEDLGLAFGFGTIYLTVFTAWWKGRTPGKRLLGLRVLQLDGRPLGWWASFERAGGYAAGLATGLLGFAQILWDPNRQAIHDRISATVVVLDGRPPVPGLWRIAVDLDPGRGVRYGPQPREFDRDG